MCKFIRLIQMRKTEHGWASNFVWFNTINILTFGELVTKTPDEAGPMSYLETSVSEGPESGNYVYQIRERADVIAEKLGAKP